MYALNKFAWTSVLYLLFVNGSIALIFPILLLMQMLRRGTSTRTGSEECSVESGSKLIRIPKRLSNNKISAAPKSTLWAVTLPLC